MVYAYTGKYLYIHVIKLRLAGFVPMGVGSILPVNNDVL